MTASQAPVLSTSGAAVVEADSGARRPSPCAWRARWIRPVTATSPAWPGPATPPGGFMMRSQAGGSAPFAVGVMGDTAYKDDGAFAFNLSHLARATVGDGVATGTILDGDDP